MVPSIASLTPPGGMRPGKRITQGLRVPPSKPVPLASRNGVLPAWLP
ncbi:MAG: hypothetical protein BWX69_03273 [Planctomycetes bacterium ADurb.Bin069]|nr:MAG: hypothetical protein BWX69_03273 [Planctomycetes bacterium ADurb.Bin069]